MLKEVAENSPELTIDMVSEIISFELTKANERIKERLKKLIKCPPTYFNIDNCAIDTSQFISEQESWYWESSFGLPFDFINIARVNSNLNELPAKKE